MSDLWSEQRQERRRRAEPLAVRMRPRDLETFVGQTHLLGPGKLLRRLIEADRMTSLLFTGPPGTGKTTLAQIIANLTDAEFVEAHAAQIGVKDLRALLADARRRLEDGGRPTILFLDEIHRFARNQQDVLLDDVENGLVRLIGATTENPFFAINSALNSRSTILRFEPLGEEDIRHLLRRAVTDERSFGGQPISVTDDALALWARVADGDARRALTALEVAVLSQRRTTTAGVAIEIDLATAEESIQAKALVYDGTGDDHYDVISVFIKSMRGGDPDAAVYWLARMLEAGEDPRFIARRIAIAASEDVGNADPQALTVAAAAWEVAERVGMPECQLTLAQAAIYVACAPKSNASAKAIWAAMREVREGLTLPVPKAFRDASYAGAKVLGHGEGYVSPHEGAGPTSYLGVDRTYYLPTNQGFEDLIRRRIEHNAGSGPAGNRGPQEEEPPDGSRGHGAAGTC